MNINDFEVDLSEVREGYLCKIFDRQILLMEKYKDIEGMPAWPLNLDSKMDQVWLKDFLWRLTEELAEAREAWLKKDMMHTYEELIDYLHFATELLILSGLTYMDVMSIDKMYERKGNFDGTMLETIYLFGLAGNHLKNKKWKQSEVLTDKTNYWDALIRAYNKGLQLLSESGLSGRDVLEIYFKKAEVNKFRQGSLY